MIEMRKMRPLHRFDPCARQPRGHQARLDHGDDEAAEHGADDRCTATEDRRAADQHGGDGDQEIALPLIAEIVLDLQRLEDRGDAARKPIIVKILIFSRSTSMPTTRETGSNRR